MSRNQDPRPVVARVVVVGVVVVAVALALAGDARAAPLVAISDEDGGEVVLVDGADPSVVARIPVGKRPRGLRFSPDARRLWVALSGTPKAGPPTARTAAVLPPSDRRFDGIAEVDVATRRVVRVLPSGTDPESFDVTPDGRRLVIADEDAGEVALVDVRAGRIVGRVRVGGEPEGVAVRPDGRVAYVTSEAEDAITVVDVARARVVARVATCARPRGVVFSRDGARAFVSCERGGAVAILDGRAHAERVRVPIPREGGALFAPLPMGLALSTDEKTLYVTTGRAGTVAAIDVARGAVTRSVLTGANARPWGLTSDGSTLYVANGPSGDLALIDAASFTLRRTLSVGKSPWGVASAPPAPAAE